jgi:hypothetical protein
MHTFGGASKMGGAKAVTAMAHKLARACFHLMMQGQEDVATRAQINQEKHRQ